jgi:hypothetical protein
MAVVFDGPNKRIIVQLGTDILDIAEMYSRWVDWFLTGDNSKYLPAMKYIGTDPTLPGQSVTPYFYMLNGWKVDACCEFEGLNHELDVTGILLSDDFSSPYYMDPTMPMTMLKAIVPIRTETVSTSGSDIDVPSIVNGVWGESVKTGMTAKQAIVEISDFVEDPPAASVDVPAIVDGLLNTEDTIKVGMSVKDALVETSDFVEGYTPPAAIDIPAIVDGVLNTEDSIDEGKDLGTSIRSLLTLLALIASDAEQSAKLAALFQRFALDQAIPVVHADTSIVAGDIHIAITDNQDGTFTEQRQ